jgi:hypothetical protein
LDATAGHSVEYLFTQLAQRPSIKIPPTQFLIRYYKHRIGFEMNRLQDSWGKYLMVGSDLYGSFWKNLHKPQTAE